MNSGNIEGKIESLIKNGYIKSAEDLKNIPIDVLCKEYDLCINDLLCYFCKPNNACECNKKKEH